MTKQQTAEERILEEIKQRYCGYSMKYSEMHQDAVLVFNPHTKADDVCEWLTSSLKSYRKEVIEEVIRKLDR